MDAAPPVDLVWTRITGGEACIGQRELGAKVQAVLGHPGLVATSEGHAGGDLVRGSVGPGAMGRGWLAVVEVRRGEAAPLRRELSLDASDCRQLDEAIVLVVALLLDSAASSPPPLTIARPAAAISVAVGPDVAVAWGMLPGLSIGFGLVTEAEVRPLWPMMLSAHVWPSSRAMDGSSGAQVGAVTAGVAVCPITLGRTRLGIFGCAGASGGELSSQGIGLNRKNSDGRRYVQVDAQVNVDMQIGAYFVIRMGVGAGFPLIQYTYDFTQADQSVHEVFRTSTVVPVGQIAIELRTPR